MEFERIIDLSHTLRPGREARALEIRQLKSTDITGAPAEAAWYIMHELSLVNHLGTHVEVPYHCLEDGADLSEIPVQQFVGDAVLLKVEGYGPWEAIPLEAVERAAAEAGGIRQGDIVLVMTGWYRHYGTEQYMQPPFLSTEAVQWLVDQDIKMLGIDTMGAMDPTKPDRQNHLPLFNAGLAYIENLTNLDRLPQPRVTVAALPPAIEGLEGIPVRVVALV